ncbi:T9SS type A sorting domain-containing protein [Candidatus Marinimicrobia bacterium]|nr:T9SS type A sorting domain-containing protein [Candidatus Neomarinimicrobiota bacterium]
MVNLVVYDIMGRKVTTLINEQRGEGYHSIAWNARNQQGAPVSAGIYFFQIQTKEFVKTRKMVILK